MMSSGELHDVRLLDPGIGGAVMLPEKALTGSHTNPAEDVDFIRHFNAEGVQVPKSTPVSIGRRDHFNGGTVR